MRLAYTCLIAGLLIAPALRAQSFILGAGGQLPVTGSRNRIISVNFQLSMPAKPTTDDGDLTKTMSDASQTLYDIVTHECQVLTMTLKGTCRLVQLNIGGNANNRVVTSASFVTANVNATFEISPAEEPSPTK